MRSEQQPTSAVDVGWKSIVGQYQRPDTRRSIIQIVNTLGPLAALMVLMYWSLRLPYWTTLLLALPAAGLLVRTFIIMHDCAHGSFFPSQRANAIVGWITGLLTTTPFAQWRHGHALHHASSGDLARRGNGDVDTLTVREYLARSWLGRLQYRLREVNGALMDHTFERTAGLTDVYRIMFSIRYSF